MSKAITIKGTLFHKAKYKKYADIVSLKSPEGARYSVKMLKVEYRRAETREKKLRIIRVLQEASNRAKASAKRKELSERERKELKKIAKIYRKAAKELDSKYKREKNELAR